MKKITLSDFINDGLSSQNQYFEKAGLGRLEDLSDIDRHRHIVDFLGHLVEEVIEARREVPRRFWKTSEIFYKDDFITEIVDVLLIVRAVCAVAEISGEVLESALEHKLKINSMRSDHKN